MIYNALYRLIWSVAGSEDGLDLGRQVWAEAGGKDYGGGPSRVSSCIGHGLPPGPSPVRQSSQLVPGPGAGAGCWRWAWEVRRL